MFKDSFEHRLWLVSTIGLALAFTTMVACEAIFAPEETATRRVVPGLIMVMLIIWTSAAVSGYYRSRAMYKKRMSGWTPPQPKLLEGFFTSRLVKLIQKIRGK